MSKAAYNTSLGNGLPAEKGVIGAFFQIWPNPVVAYKLEVQSKKEGIKFK